MRKIYFPHSQLIIYGDKKYNQRLASHANTLQLCSKVGNIIRNLKSNGIERRRANQPKNNKQAR